MRRHIDRGKGSFVLALVLGLPAGLAPESGGRDLSTPDRFAAIPGVSERADYLPRASRDGEKVTAILDLAGRSVGERMAGGGLGAMSRHQRNTLAAGIDRTQRPVRAAVARHGGHVLFSYQYAYNGIAARFPAAKLDELADLPRVHDVHPVGLLRPANAPGVRFIGGDDTWERTGHTGEGVTVGIIDTGVDYTHANFGGSGRRADFTGNDGTVVEPGTFPTAKVTGGHDFVGDEYDAASSDPAKSTPEPDPDPLDCQGHGSHVAGTAAGMGVLASGRTYGGPYDSAIYDNHDFQVGPGVAPDAQIHAYRVFGCSGSASEAVIVAAMDRALADGVDVVNMSLGSPFGRPAEPAAVAADTLAKAGVTVVASSGNSGHAAYMTGAPAIAQRAISVAAIDASTPTHPGARLRLSTGATITARNSNGAEFRGGATVPVKVLRKPDGSVGRGCAPGDYRDVEGKLVVTVRGSCARVHRAVYAQRAGAAAVAMINDAPGYPPFEGEITRDPGTGEPVDVTIPFLGVRGVLGPEPSEQGDLLAAAEAGMATLTATTVPNPGYQEIAGFSSAGPGSVDSRLKPDVTAPGVNVSSTAMGTGTGGRSLSGTSMSAPMVAGAAALVVQGNRGWAPELVKAALMNTATAGPDAIHTYRVRQAGAGVVRVRRAVTTDVLATTSGGGGSLSYGYEPSASAYAGTRTLTLHNSGSRPVTYTLAGRFAGPRRGAAISVSPRTVTLPAGTSATVDVRLELSEEALGALPPASIFALGPGRVLTVRGAVIATPRRQAPGVYALRVPFLAVPRGLAEVGVGSKRRYERAGAALTTEVRVTNDGVHAGTAQVYAWGITDREEGYRTMDVRTVGVRSRPGTRLGGSAGDRSLVFAINTHGRWSNASSSEFDVLVDTDHDGTPDYTVAGVDMGAVLGGSFTGVMGAFVVDADGELVAARYAEAPMNGSTLLLPVLASEIGLSAGDSRFAYAVNASSVVPKGWTDTTHSAVFDAHAPAVSTGASVALSPGESTELDLSLRARRFARTPALGWLIVTLGDAGGAAQADSVAVVPGGGWPRGLRNSLPQPQPGKDGEPGVVPEPRPPQQ